MSTTTTTTTTATTTTIAPEARRIAALDRPFRLRGVEHQLAAMLDPAASPPDTRLAPVVEPSRRHRRDEAGPRAADTDDTPYARHGYSGLRSRMRRRRARSGRTWGAAVRDIRAEEARAKVHEAALDVFPNSRPREGGAAHYFFMSGDESASESRMSSSPVLGEPRRRSTDMGWWHAAQKDSEAEMAEGLADVPVVEVMDVESEPECAAPRWTLADKKRRAVTERAEQVAASSAPLLSPKPRAPFKETPAAIKPIEKEAATEFEVMRRAASPPLLGGDLAFPRCASPEACRLTTDLPFEQRACEEKRRDPTQKCGLWGGYCFDREAPSVVDANKLTPPGNSGLWPRRGAEVGGGGAPSPPPTPRGMWAKPACPAPSQGLSPFQDRVEAETPPPASRGMWGAANPAPPSQGLSSFPCVRVGAERPPPPSRGLSPFQDVRVEIERPTPPPAKQPLTPEEKEARIEAEFTDAFVTQLYSYLSLGYPVTARAFDEELCAASGVGVEELRARDEEVMRRGHVCDGEVGRWAVGKCPRWRALRAYVRGWAGEQEDLDVRRGHGMGVGVWRGRGSWMP